jgi:hypothetical protein
MKLRAIFFSSVVALVLTFCYTLPAFAVANMWLKPAGDGVYLLEGTSFVNISGIHLIITYDKSLLANPKVVPGGLAAGALSAPNVASPGTIELGLLAISPPLNGTGTVATVTFNRIGGVAGQIPKPSLKIINFIDANTSAVAVTTQEPDSSLPINTDTPSPTPPGSITQTTTTTTTTQKTGTVTNQPVIIGGSLTMPTDTPPEPEKISQPATPEYKEEPRYEAPAIARETVAAEARQKEPPAKGKEKKLETQKSVLNHFRDYKGELTVKELLALFERDEKSGFRQEPAVLLADGKAVLKVTIASVEGKTAPNFALKGARLVSLDKSSENDWIVEVRPENKVYAATLTMLLDDSMIELPLTVAPKVDPDLDKSGKITEDDFKLFLKERGAEKAPKYDLNGDGKRDYVDDYIFAANYLAQLEIQPKVKTPETKPKEKPAESKPAVKPSEGTVKEKK